MRLLEDYNLDAIVLINLEYPFVDPNFIYFTKPRSGIFEHSTLVITPEEKILFTSPLEANAAKQLGVNVRVTKRNEEVFKFLKKFSRIGINKKFLPVHIYEKLSSLGLQLVDVSEELEELREIKTSEEIEFIKQAIKISEKALDKVISLEIRKMTEKELAAELEYYMKKYGADGFAFDTIVAYDENAALPHYQTGSNDHYPKKLILIDFGAKYRHYCSDITRTFILEKDREIIEAYSTVLEAQKEAIEKVKEGEIAENIDKTAREIIERKYPGKFIHSLGHMFGIQIHEGKRLAPGQKWQLKSGMVFTIEPGVYLEGKFGIRIEDDILVKKDGKEVLTSFPKELDEVVL